MSVIVVNYVRWWKALQKIGHFGGSGGADSRTSNLATSI